MADVVLFHHALGLTDGVRAFADRLRAGGHTVTTPDLYDGRTFDGLEDGVAQASSIGFDVLAAQGAEHLPDGGGPVVVAGMSLGVLPAQRLAQTDPRVAGALLLHACVPVEEFGGIWPFHVPVQVHAADGDPFFTDDGDADAARDIASFHPDTELVWHPGDGHLFTDETTNSHDPAATDVVVDRALALLAASDERDDHGRPHLPAAADEPTTARAFLDHQRHTLAWKAHGLGTDGLTATVGASALTLGGLLLHLAIVEDGWLSRRITGAGRAAWYAGADFEADWDWEFTIAATTDPATIWRRFGETVIRSRAVVDGALEDGDLDRVWPAPHDDGRSPSLRWILLHLVEEYARHVGHADLLRESIDGETGE